PPPKALVADPANDLYTTAQLAYTEGRDTKNHKRRQDAFTSAKKAFQRFLQNFPHDQRATEARFYIASCHEKLGETQLALNAYESLAQTGPPGPLTEAALSKVANDYYNTRSFEKAEPLFARLAKITTTKDTRHLANYQRALCLQHLKRTDDLKEALRTVIFDQDSPFSEKSRIAISALYAKTGEPQRAYANYQILTESPDPQVAADATLQCALLARKLDDKAAATQWFEAILTNPLLKKWQGKAQLTLMSEAYETKDHTRILELFNKGTFPLPRQQEAQRLAIAAEAFRAKGDEDRANQLYQQLAKVSPDRSQAFDASYAVLTREYRNEPKRFLNSARAFLKKHQKSHQGDPRLDNIHLMLAERHYNLRQFEEAARQYRAINSANIDPANIPDVHYRLAYSLLKSNRPDQAREAFTRFLAQHPEHKQVPRALAHRASLHLSSGAAEAAKTDYQSLLKTKPASQLRLQALNGLSEIHRKQDDYPALITIHTQLLQDFPERKQSDNATSHFILGWAHFKQEQLPQALPHLSKARELNPQGLGKDATLHLALIHFAQQNETALQSELDRLIQDYPETGIPRPVYAWLGTRRAATEKYQEAWKYLTRAVTFDQPDQTKTAVWKAYSKTSEALAKHPQTLKAVNILLPLESSPYLRAVLLQRRAKAHLGLEHFASAQKAAEEALQLKPQGNLNAELRLTLGDIAWNQKNWDTALSHYVVVAELIGQGDIQQIALRKSIAAFEEKGDATSLVEADRYKKLLK
ncbi:MAG: tetratricopeptide repeat protein, partial [Verrucomicrobiota bacterium]